MVAVHLIGITAAVLIGVLIGVLVERALAKRVYVVRVNDGIWCVCSDWLKASQRVREARGPWPDERAHVTEFDLDERGDNLK